MKDKDLHRLTHMLQSAKAILSFVKGKRQSSLNNRLLLSAVIREFEIIGEAARMVSERTKQKFSKIPWPQLIGMRNRLIHAYFDIDHDLVWKTIKNDLPSFCDLLEDIIADF
jgi:uncharacterized protein with HEPN domain